MIKELLIIPKEYKIDKKQKKLFYFLFFILFSTYPYIFYRVLPLLPVAILQLLTFSVFFSLKLINKVPFIYAFKNVIFFLFLGTILCAATNFDIGYYKQLIYIFWAFVFLRMILIVSARKFLFYYGRVLFFVGFLGALSTILALIFGVHPLFEYTNADGRPGWFVYFTFTNVQVFDIVRYSGIFDEAGAFACWSMYSLVLNKLYVKDEKIEIPLIVVTLFTFSFGYYIQLLFYILFFYVIGGNAKTKFIFFIISTILIVSYISFVTKDSPIYQLTFGRLGVDSNSNFLEENNRTEMMTIAREIFFNNPFFGIGTTRFYSGLYASDNPYETLAKDGIIGTFLLYFPIVWSLFISKFNKLVIATSSIIVVGYLQRPFHINLQHYIMLYLFAYCCYSLVRYHHNGSN